MLTDERINLLARVARTPYGPHAEASTDRSILTLAAASYGSRPTDESTVPTGFDARAAALFEAIVEGAYLVATADGVFDEEERKVFERIVTASCGGAVPQKHIADLVSDLGDQLEEDGIDRRLSVIGKAIGRREHALEILRIAVLVAQVSEQVSAVERVVLDKMASALKLEPADVETALVDVKQSLSGRS
jgi:tellurite resistance protein